MVKSAWSRRYGFVVCSSPGGARNQTDAAAKERLRRPAWVFVSPWELSPQSTLADKAALRHVERCEKDWITLVQQPLPEHKQMFSKLNTVTHSDCSRKAPPCNCLLQGQSFYKKGPRSRFSLVRPSSPLALSSLGYLSFPIKKYSASSLHFQTRTIGEWRVSDVKWPPHQTHTFPLVVSGQSG